MTATATRRAVGRESLLVKRMLVMKERQAEMRHDLRELAKAEPSAAAVHRYVTLVGESPEAERHAAKVYYLLHRAARWTEGDAA